MNYYYGTKMGGTQKYLDLVQEINDAKAGKTSTTTSTGGTKGGIVNLISSFKDIYSMLSNLNGSAANPENKTPLEQNFQDTSVFTNPGVRTGTNQSTLNTGFQSHMPTK